MNEKLMEDRLQTTFSQCHVAVVDLTGSQNNFEVRIQSSQLSSLSRVKQHQRIMDVFKEELKSGEIHALSIKIIT